MKRPLLLLAPLALFSGGCCLLPIPVYYTHGPGVEGKVLEAGTDRPIPGATVVVRSGAGSDNCPNRTAVTKPDGTFRIPADWDIHFGVWAASPSSGTCLPFALFQDGDGISRWFFNISIEAEGFEDFFGDNYPPFSPSENTSKIPSDGVYRLRPLNPAFAPDAPSPAEEKHAESAESATNAATQVDEWPPLSERPLPLKPGYDIHVVTPGETLSGIAKRNGVPMQALVDANGISDPDRIFDGQPLYVPSAPASEGPIPVASLPLAGKVFNFSTDADGRAHFDAWVYLPFRNAQGGLELSGVRGFEAKIGDGWVPVECGGITGYLADELTLELPPDTDPSAVTGIRYAWDAPETGRFGNGAGFPCNPFRLEPFDGVLGHRGTRLDTRTTDGWFRRTAYDATDGGAVRRIAESFGAFRPDTGPDADGDWSVDLDGDGVNELVCNVQWEMGGYPRVVLFRADKGGVAVCDDLSPLLPEPEETSTVFVHPADIRERYEPETRTIRKRYLPARIVEGGVRDIDDSMFEEASCTIDLDRLSWRPFAPDARSPANESHAESAESAESRSHGVGAE